MSDTTAPGPQADTQKTVRRKPVSSSPDDLKTFAVLKRTATDYLLPNWRLVAASLIGSVVVAGTTGILPWLIQQVFDEVLDRKDITKLILIAVGTIGVSAFKGAAAYTTNITKNAIGQRIISAIQSRMFTRIMRADLAWISRTHSGRFISSFMNDAGRVRDTVTMSIIDFTQNSLTVVALMGSMFFMNWKLALLGCSVIPFGMIYMRKLGKKTRKASRQGLEGTGDLSAHICLSYLYQWFHGV